MRTLKDIDVSGKRVVLRTSLNTPVDADGKVTDLFRLERGLATLKYLVEHGASVVIVGYFGRAGETLRPVAAALAALAPQIPMRFEDAPLQDALVKAKALSAGECLVLENIRREEGEEKNDPVLARLLAQFGDVFVDDAFAEAHRSYASNVGIASLLPSCAGLLMEEEVSRLSEALNPPEGSLAIIGGAKFETKQPLIEKLLPLYGEVCVAGALANDFLKTNGSPVGISLVSDTPVPKEIAENKRIFVQTDVVVSDGEVSRVCAADDVRVNERIVDAGPETAASWSEKITKVPFVLWNGPLGIYESGFVQATDALAKALVGSSARAAVGGGDTLAALENFSFDDSRVFRSTGGGAMLQFLADGTLPALEVLK